MVKSYLSMKIRMSPGCKKGLKVGVKLIRRILSGTICSILHPQRAKKAPKGYLSVISRDENTEFNHFNSQKPDYIQIIGFFESKKTKTLFVVYSPWSIFGHKWWFLNQYKQLEKYRFRIACNFLSVWDRKW